MKYYHPYHHEYPPYPNIAYSYQHPFRQYQPVDPKIFINSANKMKSLLKDAEKVIDHLSASEAFSKQLMTYAQESQLNKVNKMIYDIGLKSSPEIRYTPSGIVIKFSDQKDVTNCCLLEMKIRWGM
ncbi:hypothetical protein ACQKP0_24025 [Heyndrickxia sp. NPDC080065]|uniref:hypothetical protein n=1 Tax=Heyndrickxia sp. NPDC080065 TaxID=3390568 RepID=UPI003CFDDF2F